MYIGYTTADVENTLRIYWNLELEEANNELQKIIQERSLFKDPYEQSLLGSKEHKIRENIKYIKEQLSTLN